MTYGYYMITEMSGVVFIQFLDRPRKEVFISDYVLFKALSYA